MSNNENINIENNSNNENLNENNKNSFIKENENNNNNNTNNNNNNNNTETSNNKNKESNDEIEIPLNQICFVCNRNIFESNARILTCSHSICYSCLSRLLLLDELSGIENKNTISIPCLCHNGNLIISYKEFNNLLENSFKKSERNLEDINVNCSLHRNITAIQYCKTCKIEICFRCTDEKRHEKHNIINLDEYFRSRKIGRPNFIYDKYEDLENEINNIKETFKDFAFKEHNKKLNIIENLVEKITNLKEKYLIDYQTTLDCINKMFDTLLDIYKIYYSDLNKNEIKSVKRYKILKKIKKDFKGIEFIPEDITSLTEIEKNIYNFNNNKHLNYKFNFIHFNLKNTDTLIGHKDAILSLCQIDSGFICSGSRDQTIRIWDILNKENEHRRYQCKGLLKGHFDYIFTLLNIHNNQLLSGGRDDRLIIWDVNDYHKKEVTQPKTNVSIHFPDGSVIKEDIETGPELIPETQYNFLLKKVSNAIEVYSLGNFDKNSILFGGRDETIKIMDRKLEKINKIFKGHENTVFSVIKFNEKFICSGSADKKIKIWDVNKIKCIDTYKGHSDIVNCLVKLNNNDSLFASGSNDKIIKILEFKFNPELKSNKIKLVKNLNGHEDGIVCLIQLKDTRLASGSYDFSIRLWDVKDYTCNQILLGHKNTVFSLCQLKDGRLVSGSADKTIKIWK